MNKKKPNHYAKRINMVCDYIYAHLDETLTVKQLSEIASFSVFHFHRQFTAYTGISVFRFIQLVRLKRASYQLVFNKDYPIIQIALDAHFENPESFSRAFKKTFGQTPRDFRQQPNWAPWAEKYVFKSELVEKTMNVQIVEFPETKIAVLQHRAGPEVLNDSVSQFIQWRKETQLSPVATSRTFGVAYDDPKTTPAEEFRFDICGEVKAEVPQNVYGVINKNLPAGRCAVLRHLGPHDRIDAKVHYLYGEWLPDSGEELRDFPCYFHYINLFPEVDEHQLVTDVYLPVK